jgi:hypothetical protein
MRDLPLDPAEDRKGPSREEVLRHTSKALRQLGRIFHAEDLEAAFPEVFGTKEDERDPDVEMEEREERKRIAMEMDGPHEEGP